MFAYCGNNPVTREDTGGDLWQQVLLGVLGQYASDVIGNYFDGKTGLDLFTPTSSLAEYTAAAVTSVIPGSGIGGALARSAISEGIVWVDNVLSGNSESNDLNSSLKSICKNTFVDLAVGTMLDSFESTTSSKDFSTFARNTISKGTTSNLSKINNWMRYASKVEQLLNDMVSFAVNTGVNYLT